MVRSWPKRSIPHSILNVSLFDATNVVLFEAGHVKNVEECPAIGARDPDEEMVNPKAAL
jgi:hypothetical protein